MYNRRDNQYNNGRNQGYGGGGSYQSGFNSNAAADYQDNFQQINNLDYEIDNIRKQRQMIEQQQQMLEQQQRFQLQQKNDPWDSDFGGGGAGGGSQISVWDQPPNQFSGGRQDNYGGGRQSSYTSPTSYGRRDDRNRDARGSSRGGNSRGRYNSSRSGYNSGRGNSAGPRGEKRSAPAPSYADKRMKPDGGAVLQRGVEPNSKQRGRIEVSLGQIVKSIKERFPDKSKAIPWPILKDTLRKRLTTVLSGKPVGQPEEIVSLYRDLYPEDDDKALIVYAEQKKLEKGDAASADNAEESDKLNKTSQKDGDPKVKEKNPTAILHKLVKQRLELMLTRAYVEDLQETAAKYKPEEGDTPEEGDREQQNQEAQDGDDDQNNDRNRGQPKHRTKIPINVVKDAEENKYDEFMQGLEKEPHDYVDKVLLDYVRKDLPTMRDIMNAILLNGIVPWRLRQGMPWEKYTPHLLVRPKAHYMTWVCSPALPSIDAVKQYLAQGEYDVVAVKRPWRGLYMYVVLNKQEEYEKLLKIRNIKIEDNDIIMESSDLMKPSNRAGSVKKTSGETDAQTKPSEEHTQQSELENVKQEVEEECKQECESENSEVQDEDNGQEPGQDEEHEQDLVEEEEQVQALVEEEEQVQALVEEEEQVQALVEEENPVQKESQEQTQPQPEPVATSTAATISPNTRRSSRRMK